MPYGRYPQNLSQSRFVWLRDARALRQLPLWPGYSPMRTWSWVPNFGPEGFAPISVLWSIWAMSVAVITFPVQHWVIRTIETDGDESAVRTPLPLGFAVLFSSRRQSGICWLTRWTPFPDRGGPPQPWRQMGKGG